MSAASFASKRLLLSMVAFLFIFQVIAEERPVEVLSKADLTQSTVITTREANAGEILLLKGNPHELVKHFQKLTPSQALSTIPVLRQMSKKSISSDGTLHTVIYLLYKKLNIGTTVTTQHQISRPSQSRPMPYEYYYSIEKGQDIGPLMVLNESKTNEKGGSIIYSLLVDDKHKVSKKVGIK